jgi:hypothetical protein
MHDDGNAYKFYPNHTEWDNARASCETTAGGRLAVPKNAAEFNAVISYRCK